MVLRAEVNESARPEGAQPSVVEPEASVVLRRLDWDTRFFGEAMGTIVQVAGPAVSQESLRRDLTRILTEARSDGYAHLIFRTAVDDLPAIWAAEQAGLRLVDVALDSTFRFDSTALPELPTDLPIRRAQEADVPTLRDLAGQGFVLSRFSADPFFTEAQVVSFHREWVKNLYEGLAQAVLVCDLGGQVVGFVSCALSGDEGRIPLIATDAGYRRRGLGRALVAAALNWFAGQGVQVAHVKTQSHNYPALALYHRSGFVISKSELTFSCTLQSQDRQNEGD